MIGAEGQLLASYDKSHLVPFGEYIPMRNLLNLGGLPSIVAGLADFSAGSGTKVFSFKSIPAVTALICYEVIFPDEIMPKNSSQRPQWLVNITNDNWFGNSGGPYQHLAIARMRAIEQGLPLLRAANSGISAVISPYGSVLKSLPLGVYKVIDGNLPKAIAPTFYALYGETIAVILFIIFLLLALLVNHASIFTRRRPPHQS